MTSLARLLLEGDGAACDEAFHALLPPHVRRMAKLHWTPADVVRKVVGWLRPAPGETFLDVGAGPGKLCILAALLSPARFHGVERNAGLVELAMACAKAVDAAGATFACGDALDLDWSPFAGVYLYNPFEEPLFGEQDGQGVARETYAGRVSERLRAMRTGTRVVRFHGFGAELPEGYVCEASSEEPSGTLELWVQRG